MTAEKLAEALRDLISKYSTYRGTGAAHLPDCQAGLQALAAHAEAQAVGDDEVREAIEWAQENYANQTNIVGKHLTTLIRAATTPKPVAVNLTIQVPQEVVDFIESASKRSNYQWSEGGEYSALDHYNEGKIALAHRIIALLQQKGGE